MKALTLASLLFISSLASATDLTCLMSRSHDFFTDEQINSFIVTNVEGNEETIGLSLPDQNAMTGFVLSEDGKTVKAFFSNECDNSYEVILAAKGFKDVLTGKAKGVRGVLTFSSSAHQTEFKANLICRHAQ
ncbi:MAG: hypothetical protein AABZ31_03870 [Bdellovibrionota bacterium]